MKSTYDAIVYIDGSTVIAEDNTSIIASGSAGTDDAKVIQIACAKYNNVVLKGTFNGHNSIINLKTDNIIKGIKPCNIQNMGFFGSAIQNIELGNLNIFGHDFDKAIFKFSNSDYISLSNITISNPGTGSGACINFGVSNTEHGNYTLKNIRVTGGGRHGLYFSGDHLVGAKIINVSCYDCNFIGCGEYSRYNDWICGALVDHPHIENFYFVRCSFNNSWESGFHMETAPSKTNVVFLLCNANNNGIKPLPSYGHGFNVGKGTNLINCKSSLNKGDGIRHNNGVITNINGCELSGNRCGIYMLNPIRCNIFNNYFHEATAIYIDDDAGLPPDSNIISGNHVYFTAPGVDRAAITFYDDIGSVVIGNIINSTTKRGIYISSTSVDGIVSNNIIDSVIDKGVACNGQRFLFTNNNIKSRSCSHSFSIEANSVNCKVIENITAVSIYLNATAQLNGCISERNNS